VVRRQCDLITSCRNIPGAIVANRISIVSDRSAQWAAANVAGPTLLQLQSLKISPRRRWTKRSGSFAEIARADRDNRDTPL
jgi:hypothetical protein